MKPIVPEYIEKLMPYKPGKPIQELERELGITGSIKLASNENPLGPSPLAVEAIQGALGDLHYYPDGSCYYLREALSQKLKVLPGQIIFGSGSNEVIELVMRTLLRGDDEIIYAWPSFVVYKLVALALNIKAHEVPLKDFTHDVRAMLACVNERTRLIFLANPNNPTGTLLNKQDYLYFLENTPKDVFIVSDEAYFEYINDSDYPDSMSLVEKYPNLIVLRTFSKAYGLASLRIGYGVMSQRLADYVNRIRAPFNVNHLAQVAAEAALKDTQHVKKSVDLVYEGLAYFYDQLSDLGFAFVKSSANFILVETKQPADEVAVSLQNLGVIVRPMGGFDLGHHIRVTVGTMQQNQRFVQALAEVMGDDVVP